MAEQINIDLVLELANEGVLSDLIRDLGRVKKAVEDTTKESKKQAGEQKRANLEYLKGVENELNANLKGRKARRERTALIRANIAQLKKERKALKEAFTVKEANELNKRIREIEGNIKSLGGTVPRVGRGIKELTNLAVRFGTAMVTASIALTLGRGIKDFITGIFTINKELDSVISRVQALTGASDTLADRLKASAREASLSGLGFSAVQAGEAQIFLAQAGFEAEQIIRTLPATLLLAKSGNLELARSADIASNILKAYGKTTLELDSVVDQLAKTAASSNTNVEQLSQAFKLAGPVFKTSGFEIEELNSAIGVLGDAGIQGTLAGTALRGIVLALIKPTKDARKALERLGIEIVDETGKVKSLVDIFKQFNTAGANIEDFADIFQRRFAGTASLIADNVDSLGELGDALKDADGFAQDFADTVNDNLEGDLLSLRAVIDDLKLSLNEDTGLGNAMRNIVQTTEAWIILLRKLANSPRVKVGAFGIIELEDSYDRILIDQQKVNDGIEDQLALYKDALAVYRSTAESEIDARQKALASLIDPLKSEQDILRERKATTQSTLDLLKGQIEARNALTLKNLADNIIITESERKTYEKQDQNFKFLTERVEDYGRQIKVVQGIIDGTKQSVLEFGEETNKNPLTGGDDDDKKKIKTIDGLRAQFLLLTKQSVDFAKTFDKELDSVLFKIDETLARDIASIEKVGESIDKVTKKRVLTEEQVQELIDEQRKIADRARLKAIAKFEDLRVKEQIRLSKEGEKLLLNRALVQIEKGRLQELEVVNLTAKEREKINREADENIEKTRLKFRLREAQSELAIQQEVVEDLEDKKSNNVFFDEKALEKAVTRSGELERIIAEILSAINNANFEDESWLARALGIEQEDLDDLKEALDLALKEIFKFYQEILDADVERTKRNREEVDARLEAQKDAIEREREFAEEGKANSLIIEQQKQRLIELERIKALKKEEEALKRREQFATVQQLTSLITASARILETTAGILPPFGQILAGTAIATMFALFASAKAKSAQLTQFGEGGLIEGASHSQGGVNINAEGGEFVLNKDVVRGNRKFIEKFNAGEPLASSDISKLLQNTGVVLPEIIPNTAISTTDAKVVKVENNYRELRDEMRGVNNKLSKKEYETLTHKVIEKGGRKREIKK